MLKIIDIFLLIILSYYKAILALTVQKLHHCILSCHNEFKVLKIQIQTHIIKNKLYIGTWNINQWL